VVASSKQDCDGECCDYFQKFHSSFQYVLIDVVPQSYAIGQGGGASICPNDMTISIANSLMANIARLLIHLPHQVKTVCRNA
ncbi:MAG: hypothetical protein PUD41_06590, partial [bacterium]|nr:hypothetical protein [bacterium]